MHILQPEKESKPFFSTGATSRSSAFFGSGTGGIFLQNIACTGSESALTDCTHNEFGIHNCVHSQDVGVICLGKCKHHCSTVLQDTVQ